MGFVYGSDLDLERFTVDLQLFVLYSAFAIQFLYFFICESLFGKTVGKKLLGLKVIEAEGGGRPALWRCLLRCYLIPSGAAIPLVAGLLMAAYWEASVSPVGQTLRNSVQMIVGFVPMLIILSPMFLRKSSEAFHDLLSGTRVILDRRSRKGPVLDIASEQNQQPVGELRMGYFRLGNMLYEAKGAKVYEGVDSELNRKVWLHVNEDAATTPNEQRIMLTRTTRQRWLDGGVTDGVRWDAFEAIEGLPIQAVCASSCDVGWPEYRQLLIDVTEELKTAIGDGTLPESLSLPQVWMDRNGHAKLIDKNMVDVIAEHSPGLAGCEQQATESVVGDPFRFTSPQPQSGGSDPGARSVRLVKDLGNQLLRSQWELPISAREFLGDLQQQPDSALTLDHTIESLNSMESQLGKIGWDTRVGILGITVGMESTLFGLISSFAFLFAFLVVPAPMLTRFFLAVGLCLLVPLVLGVCFGGGLVFHLMGVTVANRKGRPAGWFKLLCRTFLAWVPFSIMAACQAVVGYVGLANLEGVDPAHFERLAVSEPMQIAMLFGMLLGLLITFAGIVFSLFKPTRGLQDILLGTRLVPK